ncbi:MAG: hypothetical protein AAGF20_11595, partial [Pseudomonadota bacterium]
LFEAYLIVDWSASAKPKTGKDSIWIGLLARDARLQYRLTTANPSTRLAARELIGDLIEKLIKRGDKVFVGFDFALGYPAGTAAAMGLTKTGDGLPWQALHGHLSAKVKEREDNSNARFALAAGMNYAMTKGPHPFWGTTKRDAVSTLSMKKGDFSSKDSLAEHRLCEGWVRETYKARPKSVWQLMGAGAVGSQALLGIPTVQALRTRFEGSRIWPFETGFAPLTPEALDGVDCVLGEVYPSLVPVQPEAGEVVDAAQVRTLAWHLQTLDKAGELAAAFGPPEGLTEAEIAVIGAEEGWILAK